MKPRLFFFHSNGFPARTYGHFLKTLETWNPEAINILGADLSSLGGTMDPMVEEVISQVAPARGNAIGIGHSLGGSLCILAQASQPNLFQNMILLDPPIFSPLKRSAIRWLRRLGILEWFSPSRRVRRRRNTFASRDQALEYFAAKPLFQDFPKSSLELYIEEGLSPAQNGFQLRIPREREAEIYDSIPDRLPETIYAGRGVLIYSQKMEVLKHLDLQWWKKSFPGFKQIGFPGGHLFPLEAPEKLGNLIQSILIDLTEEHAEKSDKPLFEVA